MLTRVYSSNSNFNSPDHVRVSLQKSGRSTAVGRDHERRRCLDGRRGDDREKDRKNQSTISFGIKGHYYSSDSILFVLLDRRVCLHFALLTLEVATIHSHCTIRKQSQNPSFKAASKFWRVTSSQCNSLWSEA